MLVVRKVMPDAVPCGAVRPPELSRLSLVVAAMGASRKVTDLFVRQATPNCDFDGLHFIFHCGDPGRNSPLGSGFPVWNSCLPRQKPLRFFGAVYAQLQPEFHWRSLLAVAWTRARIVRDKQEPLNGGVCPATLPQVADAV